MPGVSQIVFCAMHLTAPEVTGKRVVDVGSCNFNGTVRPLLESWGPESYTGIDILEGPGVDIRCSADDLVERFGEGAFDVVICFEMLEHTVDWRQTISNLKSVCAPGGIILLTTRSRGYPYHGYPDDYWRYELDEIRMLFSDCTIEASASDPDNPGVFLKARVPESFVERSYDGIRLHSMLTNHHEERFSPEMLTHPYFRRLRAKQLLRRAGEKLFFGTGRAISRALRL